MNKVRAKRKDDGAFAEDRRRAQHHGDDHQLDVADPPLSCGAQYYQAHGGTRRVSRSEHRSKCAGFAVFPARVFCLLFVFDFFMVESTDVAELQSCDGHVCALYAVQN